MKLPLNAPHYGKQFLEAQATSSMDAAFKEQQKNSFQILLEQGFPSVREEAWKYTDLTPITVPLWNLSKPTESASASVSIPEEPNTLVFINGYFSKALSSKHFDEALEILPLKNFQESLDATFAPTDHLNAAFLTDGVVITVKAHQEVQHPIHLYHLHEEDKAMHHVRHLLIAEEGSKAIFIEHHEGTSEASYFATTLSHIHCGKQAEITYYELQDHGLKAYALSHTVALISQQGTFKHFKSDLGGRLVRSDLEVQLKEPLAHCELSGLYFSRQQQHMDNHTFIHHEATQTTSHEFYEGILQDRSRAVFHGKILVQKDAQKIESNQTNHNLLLSKHAEIDTKPQLEIYADDVKCSHGATVGQLDEDSLFYLQSRGIALEVAKNILIFGFAKNALHAIHHEPTRRHLEKKVLALLKHS